MNQHETDEFQELIVYLGNPVLPINFMGRWLVEPSSEQTRSRLSDLVADLDPEAYWGVALTREGQYAVYTAHCYEKLPANLHRYDTLDDAVVGGLPDDIASMAAAAMGDERQIWLDI
jgi:hypothetical protein